MLHRRRIRIAPSPELLDKGISFIIGLEFCEYVPLLFGDDPEDILFQPFLIIRARTRFVLRLLALSLDKRRESKKNEEGQAVFSSVHRSVVKLQCELNDARVATLSRNLAERAGLEVRVGIAEVHMIENVEEFSAKLDVLSFGDPEVFQDSEGDVPIAGPPEEVPGNGADGSQHRPLEFPLEIVLREVNHASLGVATYSADTIDRPVNLFARHEIGPSASPPAAGLGVVPDPVR